VQRLHALGLGDVAEGTVYPALTRLEREGRLSARLVASSSGPPGSTTADRRRTRGAHRRSQAWNRLTSIVDETLSRPLPAEPSGPAVAAN